MLSGAKQGVAHCFHGNLVRHTTASNGNQHMNIVALHVFVARCMFDANSYPRRQAFKQLVRNTTTWRKSRVGTQRSVACTPF